MKGEIKEKKSSIDHWGIWVSRISRKKQLLALFFWSIYSRVVCIYWNISLGNGCHFWGKMIFNRFPGSLIAIGKNCRFRSAVWSNLIGLNRPCIIATLTSHAKITIGESSGFSGTSISAAESVTIGANVICGGNVTITDTDWHGISIKERVAQKKLSAPITIEDNVWIGLNVTVLKGVTIGKGAVIAANSTVTHNIPSFVIAAGTPAKAVKKIPVK